MEMVYFSVNNKVLQIRTTKEEAIIYKTDDEYAIRYISRLVEEGKLIELGIYPNEVNTLEICRGDPPVNEENLTKIISDDIKEDVIWTKKGKPSTIDIEAINFMLGVRGTEKYVAKFDDKRNVKLHVWQLIADEMTAAGFNVGPPKQAADKLRQKFQNLQKLYVNYNLYVKNTTGTSPKPPPEHYEAMHAILGDKHKSHPKFLTHSMDMVTESVTDDSEDTVPNNNILSSFESDLELSSTSKSKNNDNILSSSVNKESDLEMPSTSKSKKIVNRFESVAKSTKPINKKDTLLENIKNTYDEVLQNNKQHNDQLQQILIEQNTLLKQQNDQRDKLINLFEVVVKATTSKKRKKRASSDSE